MGESPGCLCDAEYARRTGVLPAAHSGDGEAVLHRGADAAERLERTEGFRHRPHEDCGGAGGVADDEVKVWRPSGNGRPFFICVAVLLLY